MKVWEEYDFSSADFQIWEIYKAYEQFARKLNDFRKYLPTKIDPRDGKNWKYFKQIYDNFSSITSFDPYIFIEAQFRNIEKGKMLYPAQLKTKTAIKKYEEHKAALKIVDVNSNTEKIISNLASTFKFLKKWWKKNKLLMDDYNSFFTCKDGELLSEGMHICLQGMISKYFMSVSKHFLREYKSLDLDMRYEVIPPEKLKSYKINLILDTEAYDFAKELFNSEII